MAVKKKATPRRTPRRTTQEVRKASHAKKAAKDGEARRMGRANYGANEMPRQCRRCGHPESSIVNTISYDRPTDNPRRITRRRRCLDCGQIFATIQNLEAPDPDRECPDI